MALRGGLAAARCFVVPQPRARRRARTPPAASPSRLAAAVLVLWAAALPAQARAAAQAVVVPPARVGDAWSVGDQGATWDLRATGMSAAVDGLGGDRRALIVDVEGWHPITSEFKEVTRHTIAVDAASGVSIADVTAWEFAGNSEPGAYASYEPNNPDGWPGWVIAGGVLAGRTLAPGSVLDIPFVMTSTSGADRIRLTVTAAADGPWGRCVVAGGSVHYPEWITWDGSTYERRTLDVELQATMCEGSPYATHTRLRFTSDTASWGSDMVLQSLVRGTGEPVAAGPFTAPARHLLASTAPFQGALVDGGPLPWSVVEAQQAAARAPGLIAWRALHSQGYLVEAVFTGPDQAGPSGTGADEWRLVYAAPGGAQHAVAAQRRAGVITAVDLPQLTPYPHPVPALRDWPDAIVTPGGIVRAWQQHAGFAADVLGLRWEPLRSGLWSVAGQVAGTCGESCTTTVGMLMPYRFDTGAAQTGEHPLAPA